MESNLTASPKAQPTNKHWVYLAIMLLTLMIRGGFATLNSAGLETDPDGYRHIAAQIRETGSYQRRDETTQQVFPTAYRPPLYSLILAVVSPAPQAILILHIILASLTSICIHRIGELLQLGKLIWVAIVGTLLDPILLNQSALPMTETLAALFAVAMWLGFVNWWQCRNWRNAILLGIAMGLAVLCRPTFAPWAGLLLMAAIATNRSGLATLFVVVAVVSPWVLRNQQVFGKPVFLTTHGGYTFLLGNNDQYYDYLHSKTVDIWNPADFHTAWGKELSTIPPQNELERDRLAYRTARGTIAKRPGDFCKSCSTRIAKFWRLTPAKRARSEGTRTTLMRYAVGFWYAIAFAIAGATLVRNRRELEWKVWQPAILLCLTFTLIHAFYWSDMRMRGPVMPAIYLFIAYGISKFQNRDGTEA